MDTQLGAEAQVSLLFDCRSKCFMSKIPIWALEGVKTTVIKKCSRYNQIFWLFQSLQAEIRNDVTPRSQVLWLITSINQHFSFISHCSKATKPARVIRNYDLSCLAGKQDRKPPNTCHFSTQGHAFNKAKRQACCAPVHSRLAGVHSRWNHCRGGNSGWVPSHYYHPCNFSCRPMPTRDVPCPQGMSTPSWSSSCRIGSTSTGRT